MFLQRSGAKGNLGRWLLLSGPVQALEDSEVSQRPFIIFLTLEFVSFTYKLILTLSLFSKMVLTLLFSFKLFRFKLF